MWTCPRCGEMHDDRYKECWKCAAPEHSTPATEAEPKPAPPPPPLRSTGSILLRVVVAFFIGMLAGMAIFHRSGLAIEIAATYGLYMGGGLALFVGIFFWILFPYEPNRGMPPEEGETSDASMP